MASAGMAAASWQHGKIEAASGMSLLWRLLILSP